MILKNFNLHFCKVSMNFDEFWKIERISRIFKQINKIGKLEKNRKASCAEFGPWPQPSRTGGLLRSVSHKA
jgi:hypothetical protein